MKLASRKVLARAAAFAFEKIEFCDGGRMKGRGSAGDELVYMY